MGTAAGFPKFIAIRSWLGHRLSAYLSEETVVHSTSTATDLLKPGSCPRPGDVVLVEGHSRVSVAIHEVVKPTLAIDVAAVLVSRDAAGDSCRRSPQPPD